MANFFFLSSYRIFVLNATRFAVRDGRRSCPEGLTNEFATNARPQRVRDVRKRRSTVPRPRDRLPTIPEGRSRARPVRPSPSRGRARNLFSLKFDFVRRFARPSTRFPTGPRQKRVAIGKTLKRESQWKKKNK